MTVSVQGKMARGALWMLLFKLLERSLGLISTLILVRLLAPADFGIIAMAMAFVAMAELLSAFGFDIALIQDQKATEQHYHSAWTCNVLLGVLIAALMWAAAAPIAQYYRQPEVFWVVCALAVGPLITGAENIGVVAFRKDLDFRREFAFQISRKLIGFVVTVSLAVWLQTYWALAAGILTARLAGTVISYLAHPFRPHLSVAKAAELLGYSKWLVLSNVVIFLKERSSDFIIGRALGPAPLGLYNVSYEVSYLPMTELSAPINRALLPGFAKIAADPELVRQAYANSLGLLALFAIPAAGGLLAVAPFLVPVMLGAKWIDAVPLIETLAVSGALVMIHSSICAVLMAHGHPRSVARVHALYVATLVPLLVVLVGRLGIAGAPYAALATSIITTPAYLYALRRHTGIPMSLLVRCVARPLLATVVMVGVVRWAFPADSASMSIGYSAGVLLAAVIMGAAVYMAAVVATWAAVGRPAGAERLALDQLRALLSARRSGASGRAL